MENLNYGSNDTYYEERVIWTANTPDFIQQDKKTGKDWFLLNIPMFLHIADIPMEELTYAYLLVRVPDPEDTALIDDLKAQFADAVPHGVSISAAYEKKKDLDKVVRIINIIFSTTIAIMMFLCFFSLTASMSANLYDQTNEIGLLRAIGLTKGRVRMLYFYEALILVFASCLLGVFVGTVIGYTMTLQQNLFL